MIEYLSSILETPDSIFLTTETQVSYSNTITSMLVLWKKNILLIQNQYEYSMYKIKLNRNVIIQRPLAVLLNVSRVSQNTSQLYGTVPALQTWGLEFDSGSKKLVNSWLSIPFIHRVVTFLEVSLCIKYCQYWAIFNT